MGFLHFLRTPPEVIGHLLAWGRETSLDQDQLEKLQEKKLEKILDAASRTPFYGKMKLPSAGEFLENPGLVPFTMKPHLRDGPESFIPKGTDIRTLSYHQTSGSTGVPTRIYMGRDVAAYRVAVMLACDMSFGRKPFELYGRVHGFGFDESYILRKLGVFPKLFMSVLEPPEKNFQMLQKFRPRMLRGYPSAIHLLSKMNRASETPLKLRSVVSVAEHATEEVKRAIGESFDCPVYNHYGSMEASSIARDCTENGSLHVDSHACLVEIVDEKGRPRKSGEGEIVVTPLFNTTMPLLRFRLGDLASWGNRCSCGRETPVLKGLSGRMDDCIVLPSGRTQPGKNFHLRYEELEHFFEYQVYQEELEVITFYYVPVAGRIPDPVMNGIRQRISAQCLGEKVELRFEAVKSIPKGRTGKLRTVFSRVRTGL